MSVGHEMSEAKMTFLVPKWPSWWFGKINVFHTPGYLQQVQIPQNVVIMLRQACYTIFMCLGPLSVHYSLQNRFFLGVVYSMTQVQKFWLPFFTFFFHFFVWKGAFKCLKPCKIVWKTCLCIATMITTCLNVFGSIYYVGRPWYMRKAKMLNMAGLNPPPPKKWKKKKKQEEVKITKEDDARKYEDYSSNVQNTNEVWYKKIVPMI